MVRFEERTGLVLPDDLKAYFLSINGWDQWDHYNTEFFSLAQFKTVQDEVGNFGGIPDYRDIVKTLPEHINCYVFADHFTLSAVYAIRLYPYISDVNEVYVIHGSDYKLVANSFNEYIHKYVNEETYPF